MKNKNSVPKEPFVFSNLEVPEVPGSNPIRSIFLCLKNCPFFLLCKIIAWQICSKVGRPNFHLFCSQQHLIVVNGIPKKIIGESWEKRKDCEGKQVNTDSLRGRQRRNGVTTKSSKKGSKTLASQGRE